jgi:hypothetical protein
MSANSFDKKSLSAVKRFAPLAWEDEALIMPSRDGKLRTRSTIQVLVIYALAISSEPCR